MPVVEYRRRDVSGGGGVSLSEGTFSLVLASQKALMH